uniref:Uncharacterized protein n=1 Tax=Setaria digitata TaxID=48799 RepID=A0A915PSY2_9BILA
MTLNDKEELNTGFSFGRCSKQSTCLQRPPEYPKGNMDKFCSRTMTSCIGGNPFPSADVFNKFLEESVGTNSHDETTQLSKSRIHQQTHNPEISGL